MILLNNSLSTQKRASKNPLKYIKKPTIFGLLLSISILIGACTPRQLTQLTPTPIPTLIPATMPPIQLRPTQTTLIFVESFPAGLPSADNGKSLYVDYCASCHGKDGNGLVPNSRDFGDVDYMRGETPLELYGVITEGRGDEMPAFGEEISSDQRWDIVYYLWRFSTTDEYILIGGDVYTKNCVSCHGEDGRSMILGAANFMDQQYFSNRSPSDLYVVVTQGLGSMPAWQSRLTQEERWAVIDYLRTFTYDPFLSGEGVITTQEATIPVGRPVCDRYNNKTLPFNWSDIEIIAAGKTLYSGCASCHGENGTGVLPGTPNFSDSSFQSDLNKYTAIYFCSIAEGINLMPPYKSTLSEDEIWKLLVYIGTFEE